MLIVKLKFVFDFTMYLTIIETEKYIKAREEI